jgi:hypothetical protein
MSISFFARPSFLGNALPSLTKEPYPFRLSSDIRAKQIAEYIGAKYNPTEGYENDLCIYVKPRSLDKVKDGDYVDVADGDYLIEPLKARHNIKVIAASQYSYEFLKQKLENELVLIPQQHLNWENAIRDRKGITTGGYIGKPSPQAFKINEEIRKRLKVIGFDFITCFSFKNRQDAVNFYKSIDLLIIGFKAPDIDWPFATPQKMINAASFGVPSVAYKRAGYKEFEGNYIPVRTMDSLVAEVEKVKKEDYYTEWANKIIKETEKYHISKIAEMYKQLETRT